MLLSSRMFHDIHLLCCDVTYDVMSGACCVVTSLMMSWVVLECSVWLQVESDVICDVIVEYDITCGVR